jgi:hypothetical protein
MKVHSLGTVKMDDSHGNVSRNKPRRVDPHAPVVRKVPADSVPYGESISRNGRTVYAAYDGETLIAVAATADEVRAKYRLILREQEQQAHAEKAGSP